jgi:hypothetical protein
MSNFFGVMHIGSEQVSLQIVEYTSLEDMRAVERASSQVTLGEETFKTGRISFATVRELCELLKGYRRLLHEYGVKDYRLLATTAIREADNQQYIIDQVRLKTGLTLEVVDMLQEMYQKYIALFRDIEAVGLSAEPEGILFVEFPPAGCPSPVRGRHYPLPAEYPHRRAAHQGELRKIPARLGLFLPGPDRIHLQHHRPRRSRTQPVQNKIPHTVGGRNRPAPQNAGPGRVRQDILCRHRGVSFPVRYGQEA